MIENYSSVFNGYWNSHPIGSPPSALEGATIADLMLNSFNLDLSNLSLNETVTGPGWALWIQQYDGLEITNSSQIYFQVYPPTGAVIQLLVFEGSGWNAIPSNFSLGISPALAMKNAEQYATVDLHFGQIGYIGISLQVIQEHIYYSITLSDQSKTYQLFMNPITGEIGFPQS
jgi:hypothetical protein